MSKICNKCQKTVNDNVRTCPDCGGTDFHSKQEITTASPTMLDKILYWPYPEGRMLAKSKLSAIIVFVTLFLFWGLGGAPLVFIPLAVIFAALFFLVGYALHQILPKPTIHKIRNNDYGLIPDIAHLLFYWQDKNGNYELSKTKLISFFMFLAMFVVGLFSFNTSIIFSAVLFGVLFTAPVFALGAVIHKITYKKQPVQEIPEKKVKKIEKTPETTQTDDTPVIGKYGAYKVRLNQLKTRFDKKEASARDLIAKRFEPPQLTYTRFITGVDKSRDIFNKNHDSAMTMINLADEYSPRIADEIESKITVLEAIISKMDNLTNELIINENLSETGDVDNLIGEMDNLIDSVKDYNE